jgi:hypothetical protein
VLSFSKLAETKRKEPVMTEKRKHGVLRRSLHVTAFPVVHELSQAPLPLRVVLNTYAITLSYT